MRVAIIAPNVSTPYLGPSSVSHNLLKGFDKINRDLKAKEVEVTFLSINDIFKEKKITENITIFGLRRYKYPLIILLYEIQTLFTKGNFDIIHSHSIYELMTWLLRRKKILFTLHGLFWKEKEWAKNKFLAEYWALLNFLRLKLYYPKLSRFVAISQYVVEELKAKGFDTSKAVIIENPVSDEFFEV
ncbi:MAG: glycosyltransferase, partial [Archaeoglobaceae archaeon]